MVRIHVLKANSDADHREGAKQDIGVEENLGLLFEKLFVIPNPIIMCWRHIIQVNEIVEPIETQIIDLLWQDKGTKHAENKRVKMLVAEARFKDTKEQGERKKVE